MRDTAHELLKLLGADVHSARFLMAGGLLAARSLPLIMMAPFLAGQAVPQEVRVSFTILFVVVLWPLVDAHALSMIPVDVLLYIGLLLKEFGIGFVIGYASSTFFATMETAGRFIDTARGAAMAEILVPNSKQRATAVGSFYNQLLLVIFLSIGGHRIFLNTFFESFLLIPIYEYPEHHHIAWPMVEHVLMMSSNIVKVALILSAPAAVATFVTDLVFGILNRVSPQLNAYFLAMPVKALAALMLMYAGFYPFYERILYFITAYLNNIQEITLLLR
jgi:flagellar biosynthetic protein FliR